MADTKTSQLTQLAGAPDPTDLFMLVDVSDTTMAATGTNKRMTAAYLARSDGAAGLITGSGLTLTVPAAGTAALRVTGAANAIAVFTDANTIGPAAASASAVQRPQRTVATGSGATAGPIDIAYGTISGQLALQTFTDPSGIFALDLYAYSAGATYVGYGRVWLMAYQSANQFAGAALIRQDFVSNMSLSVAVAISSGNLRLTMSASQTIVGWSWRLVG